MGVRWVVSDGHRLLFEVGHVLPHRKVEEHFVLGIFQVRIHLSRRGVPTGVRYTSDVVPERGGDSDRTVASSRTSS